MERHTHTHGTVYIEQWCELSAGVVSEKRPPGLSDSWWTGYDIQLHSQWDGRRHSAALLSAFAKMRSPSAVHFFLLPTFIPITIASLNPILTVDSISRALIDIKQGWSIRPWTNIAIFLGCIAIHKYISSSVETLCLMSIVIFQNEHYPLHHYHLFMFNYGTSFFF